MMEISLNHYLVLSGLIFGIGLFGLLAKAKHIIGLLLSIELMLLAININFVAFSAYLGDLSGQIYALFILAVAADEAAVGLAIFVLYFRNQGSTNVDQLNILKG